MTGRRYTIEFDAPAAKSVAKLEKRTARRIRKATDALADEPHPRGSVKLAGREDLFRIRVGDYRVVYTVIEERVVVLILRIAHRREVYRMS